MVATSWYERGARYWSRRAGFAFAMALVVVCCGLIIGGFLSAIRRSSNVAFIVLLSIEIVYSVVIVAYLAVRTANRWNRFDSEAAARGHDAARRSGSSGAAVGLMARAGSGLGAAFLVFGSLLFIGLYVALLLCALLPELPWERPARLRMAEALHDLRSEKLGAARTP